ncbi:MSHA biogenesis protein MshK [Pseudoduganella namucuonensis]|uniref:MSHA biogenesis protein MshK n=1 Tax=Pseudoduganella namucuonensis TaxID=1035707 RepID=A0A1I7L5R6_9BURK|nr:MSHA biogenesis protein MshK [Pseudoduganella namucuonensis]
MDSPVKQALVFAWALAAVPVLAAAQAVGDPTQPPAMLVAPGGEPAASSGPAVPQLQSILVSREPGGRRVAVINGEMVRKGMKVGDAVVERVGETEVVLLRGKTRETLRLFPKAEKR